ncbi:hypothetical protein BOTBODRAFT_333925 [Botryobasidium botryosum FD-172 SS1]|uniref:Uncharacterized protein n=1 Tax=Botryobasidium botryosum (strain FD-172 SS1) TaxID=930990 RepID=A0A067MGM6_BOTB1|nr:hypothetical protein BOTBODRAFT_333925 [Botryobasidium botryosum FD-172 SS1]
MSSPQPSSSTPSRPIPIRTSSSDGAPRDHHHGRSRSASISGAFTYPRVHRPSDSPPIATSPLSYFLNNPTSPMKPTFSSFSSQMNSALVDEDAEIREFGEPALPPSPNHGRRASSGWSIAPKFGATPADERGHGVIRRLSLGAFASKPSPSSFNQPPPSAPPNIPRGRSPPTMGLGLQGVAEQEIPAIRQPMPRKRRSTMEPGQDKKRSVSPMGERMLKGHFDGFGF